MHSTAAVRRIDVAGPVLDPRTTALVLIDLQKGIASMPQATASSNTPILKPYLMVRPVFRAYVFLRRPHRACGGQMAAERTAHATPYAPE
jgi:nicotinamidase-related amidase